MGQIGPKWDKFWTFGLGVCYLNDFLFFLPSTEDTVDLPEYHREKVECADFCSLDWKLHGLQVNGQVRKILETLG